MSIKDLEQHLSDARNELRRTLKKQELRQNKLHQAQNDRNYRDVEKLTKELQVIQDETFSLRKLLAALEKEIYGEFAPKKQLTFEETEKLVKRMKQ